MGAPLRRDPSYIYKMSAFATCVVAILLTCAYGSTSEQLVQTDFHVIPEPSFTSAFQDEDLVQQQIPDPVVADDPAFGCTNPLPFSFSIDKCRTCCEHKKCKQKTDVCKHHCKAKCEKAKSKKDLVQVTLVNGKTPLHNQADPAFAPNGVDDPVFKNSCTNNIPFSNPECKTCCEKLKCGECDNLTAGGNRKEKCVEECKGTCNNSCDVKNEDLVQTKPADPAFKPFEVDDPDFQSSCTSNIPFNNPGCKTCCETLKCRVCDNLTAGGNRKQKCVEECTGTCNNNCDKKNDAASPTPL